MSLPFLRRTAKMLSMHLGLISFISITLIHITIRTMQYGVYGVQGEMNNKDDEIVNWRLLGSWAVIDELKSVELVGWESERSSVTELRKEFDFGCWVWRSLSEKRFGAAIPCRICAALLYGSGTKSKMDREAMKIFKQDFQMNTWIFLHKGCSRYNSSIFREEVLQLGFTGSWSSFDFLPRLSPPADEGAVQWCEQYTHQDMDFWRMLFP